MDAGHTLPARPGAARALPAGPRQGDVALAESWVREVERGEQYAPAYLVAALATAIGVSPGWFYGEDRKDLDVKVLAEAILAAVRQEGSV